MKHALLILVTTYQKIISPLFHNLLGVKSGCRSYPTCSDYAKDAIMRYGAGKGTVLVIRRVVNCQPFFSI